MAAPTESKNFSSLTAVSAPLTTSDETFFFDVSEAVATDKPKRGPLSALITLLNTLYQPLAAVLTNTTAAFTTEQETKLSGIEALADVTDAANVATAGAGVFAPIPTINAQTGTSYTAVLSDANITILLTNASPIAMTIPANASVAYPVGTELTFIQGGAGAVTVGITSDTLNVESTLTKVLNGRYAAATAKKLTSTTWVIFGNLVFA